MEVRSLQQIEQFGSKTPEVIAFSLFAVSAVVYAQFHFHQAYVNLGKSISRIAPLLICMRCGSDSHL